MIASDSAVEDRGDVLLELDGVTKRFPTQAGWLGRRESVHAVNGVSLQLRRGETLGLVGESGCGKSTLARCALRLCDIDEGVIRFDGRDISKLRPREMRPMRRKIQMIFQDPFGSLNPRRRVGSIIADPLRIHAVGDRTSRKRAVQEAMDLVGLNPEHYNRFPAEFSGGQRQRIGIARALVLRPELIVCDEPVSALDVSIQAQILNLLSDLQRELGLTYLFIAHDLSVVRHISDRVAVMYLGQVVETAETRRLFESPRHPYTAALLSAVQEPDPDLVRSRQHIILGGDPPSPLEMPSGCPFHPRCPKAQSICAEVNPTISEARGDGITHGVACHFPVEEGETLRSVEPLRLEGAASLIPGRGDGTPPTPGKGRARRIGSGEGA